MRKKINNLDSVEIIDEKEGYTTTISYSKGYYKNGELIKSFSFSIWDDMAFYGCDFIDKKEYNENLTFEFNKNDKVFYCLNRFLGDDAEFILDDDDTSELFKKYMIIKRYDNNINISFYNKKNQKSEFDMYGAFVKNIGPDIRSKIEEFDVKIRLLYLLYDIKDVLLEENHQISLDEYCVLNNLKYNYNNKILKLTMK